MKYQVPLLGVMITALSIHGRSLSENMDASQAVSNNANYFGIKLNKAFARRNSGNYISSPFSVDMALAMIFFGAGGNTKVKLQQFLRLPTDEAVVKKGYETVIRSLNDTQGVDLALATKMFTSNGFKVRDEFKGITKTYFRSESENLDFSNAARAAEDINKWAAASTKNLVKDIFKPEDINVDTRLVLVNAVCFKGKWANPFDSTLTHPNTFHVNGTTTKNVDTMYRHGDYNWGMINNLNAKYIELPYEADEISMIVIVPNQINGLAHIEDNLNEDDLNKLIGQPKSRVQLSIPKFTVESKFDLESTLRELGIEDIFGNTANFSGINDSARLKVSKVLQKSFIEVNEEGSEAAAVTGIEMETLSALHDPEFKIDKPFFFTIRSKKNGINVFNGRIGDLPTSGQLI